jgi:hypothetical protein
MTADQVAASLVVVVSSSSTELMTILHYGTKMRGTRRVGSRESVLKTCVVVATATAYEHCVHMHNTNIFLIHGHGETERNDERCIYNCIEQFTLLTNFFLYSLYVYREKAFK